MSRRSPVVRGAHVAESRLIDLPTGRDPPASRTFQGQLAGAHFDARLMSRQSAGKLFENMPEGLTYVSRSDSGAADDYSNFHSASRFCTASALVPSEIEQSMDQSQHTDCTLLRRLAYRAGSSGRIGLVVEKVARPVVRLRNQPVVLFVIPRHSGDQLLALSDARLADAVAIDRRTEPFEHQSEPLDQTHE